MKSNFVKESLAFLPIIKKGFSLLQNFRVGDDNQKVTIFDFCFKNQFICGVTQKREGFLEEICNF